MDEKLSANQFVLHKFANETRGRSEAKNLYIDQILCLELKNHFKDLIPKWPGSFYCRRYYLHGTEWFLYRKSGIPPQLITVRLNFGHNARYKNIYKTRKSKPKSEVWRRIRKNDRKLKRFYLEQSIINPMFEENTNPIVTQYQITWEDFIHDNCVCFK